MLIDRSRLLAPIWKGDWAQDTRIGEGGVLGSREKVGGEGGELRGESLEREEEQEHSRGEE